MERGKSDREDCLSYWHMESVIPISHKYHLGQKGNFNDSLPISLFFFPKVTLSFITLFLLR